MSTLSVDGGCERVWGDCTAVTTSLGATPRGSICAEHLGGMGWARGAKACVATMPLLLAAVQTLQACFDGGEPGSSLVRRCLIMRVLVSLHCTDHALHNF